MSCSNLIHSRILTSPIVKTKDSAMLKLVCYVRNDDYKQTFEVEIDKTKTVAALRKAIKEEMRPRFDDIPADSFLLWNVSVHCNLNLKKEVKELRLVDDDSLHPLKILSDIFSSGLDSRYVHIIIDCPHSGELQLPNVSTP